MPGTEPDPVPGTEPGTVPGTQPRWPNRPIWNQTLYTRHMSTHTDILVIGGGNAGLCAAIEAAESGARVLLVDSAPEHARGGNSRHTRNFRVMHDQPVATLTEHYSADEYLADLRRVTQGVMDQSLAELMIAQTPDLLDFYLSHGVHFQPALTGTLSLSHSNAFFLGGGCALLNTLYLAAQSLGVTIWYDTPVTDAQFEQDRITSVTALHQGVEQDIQANAIIVCSGGFQANTQWMKAIWGPAAENFVIRGTPYNRGELMRILTDQGALTVGSPDQCHAIALDARTPKFDAGIVSRVDCVCFSIVVNQQGRRFYDEGEDFWPKRYAIWGRLIAQQPQQIAYAVYDNKVADRFMPSLYPPISATSMAELAAELQLQPETLQNTVAEYNTAVVAGDYNPSVLDNCHTQDLRPAKSHWALPIDTPPYFAYPLAAGITFTYMGLKVDADARVGYGNDVFANVYAAGEIMAGNILGQGYCAGTGMAIGGVFGRIAGAHAADSLA